MPFQLITYNFLITSKFSVQTEPEFMTGEVEGNEQEGYMCWDIYFILT